MFRTGDRIRVRESFAGTDRDGNSLAGALGTIIGPVYRGGVEARLNRPGRAIVVAVFPVDALEPAGEPAEDAAQGAG